MSNNQGKPMLHTAMHQAREIHEHVQDIPMDMLFQWRITSVVMCVYRAETLACMLHAPTACCMCW